MNKKYLSGLLTGLAGGLLVMTIAMFILLGIVNGKVQLNSQSNNEQAGEEVSGKSTSAREVNQKVALLEAYIKKYYLEDVDENDFADGIYKGVVESLKDPYSTYYTAEEYKAMTEARSGTYYGIGASVSQKIDTGIITIVKPFESGPAYEAGILPGDIIYKVEGEEVTGEDITEVVTKMKGPAGTKVKMSVIREGETEPLEFTLERRKIEVPTIEFEMLENKIGYIAIAEFDEVTAQQFRSALNKLEKQGMKGVVIDLRGNGGGRLDTVVDMLDRILPEGMIVSMKDKNGNGEEYKSTNKEQLKVPLSVLINGNSASASEVFAGAVQDYGIGTLVGTTSYGKGIVQTVFPLADHTAIKLTVAKYYTPKGRDIHKKGIEPDVKAELDKELLTKLKITHEEDNQLQTAIKEVEKKIK